MNVTRRFFEIKDALKVEDNVVAQLVLAEAVALLASSTISIDIGMGPGSMPVKVEYSER